MNKGLFLSGFMLASFSLFSACGGGGSGSSTSSSTNNTNTLAYTGNTASAAITTSNQKTLVSALLISALDVTTLANEAGAVARGNDSLAVTPLRMKNFYQQLVSATDAQLSNAQARNINLTQNCTAGGTLQVAGSLDDSTSLGTLQFTFTQCNTGDALVNGTGALTLNQVDMNLRQVTAFTFTANSLSETIGSSTYSIGGNLQYSKNTTTGAEQGISNIVRKTSAGKQSLDVDLTFVTDSTGDSVTGKLCEGANGCVNVVTPEPYVTVNGVLTQGKIMMTGTNASKLKLYSVSNVLWMDLDANGDGEYEATTRYVP